MPKEFWLGLIGGIFGILGGLAAAAVGAAGETLGIGAGSLYGQAIVAIIFSTLGIISPAVIDSKKWVGVLMIISGIIVLIAISLFGVLTLILFVIGGAVALKNRESGGRRQSSGTPRSSSRGL